MKARYKRVVVKPMLRNVYNHGGHKNKINELFDLKQVHCEDCPTLATIILYCVQAWAIVLHAHALAWPLHAWGHKDCPMSVMALLMQSITNIMVDRKSLVPQMSSRRSHRRIVEEPPALSLLLHQSHAEDPADNVVSQRVEALTCPRCMAPDHSKEDCTQALLVPLRNKLVTGCRTPDCSDLRKSGSIVKECQYLKAPAPARAYCFLFSERQCFCHPKPYDRKHRCIRCRKEHHLIDCKATYFPVSMSAPWPLIDRQLNSRVTRI